MMTLSSSTWLMSALPGNKGFYTIEQCLDTMRAAGFEYMDANLWSLSGRNRPAGQDNWKEWAQATREYADKLCAGVRVRRTSNCRNGSNRKLCWTT